MPVTLVITVGSALANSYCTLAEAEVFADEMFPRPDVWRLAGADEKSRALLRARQELDQERFVGDRVDETQALAWPRGYVPKPYAPTSYLTTEIPTLIKRAQALRAIYLVEQAGSNADDLAGVASFSLGSEFSATLDAEVTSQTERDRYFATVLRPMLGNLVYAPQLKMVR